MTTGKLKNVPTVPPHVVIQEMVEVAQKHGYQLQYGVSLSYWIDTEQFVITVPKPDFEMVPL